MSKRSFIELFGPAIPNLEAVEWTGQRYQHLFLMTVCVN
jgi:hypothetical protein